MHASLKRGLWLLGLWLPASHALASDWFAWSSDDTLRWRSQGQYLHLSTEAAGGVKVVEETPADLWGLAPGDVILAADGKPVHHVSELMAALRAHDASPLPLTLRRGGAERQLLLASQARVDLLRPPPAPPAPPVPGAPPAPPAPPPPGG